MAGSVENSSLQDIEAVGTNSVTGLANVGGLVGTLRNADPTKLLKNLAFSGLVQITPNPPPPATATNYYMDPNNNFMGGVVGNLEGTLETASFSGKVSGGSQVGGIVGRLKGTLRSAYTQALSTVESNYIGGGIAGVLGKRRLDHPIGQLGGHSRAFLFGPPRHLRLITYDLAVWWAKLRVRLQGPMRAETLPIHYELSAA